MLNTTPYLWVVSHLQVIGWPAIIYGVYRIVIACFKVGRAAVIVQQRVLKGEETIHLVATNHLPHIQQACENNERATKEMHETLKSIREDLRLLLVKD